MNFASRSWQCCFTMLATCSFFTAAPSFAQDNQPGDIHWAYSAYFGTGWYRISDDRDVFVIRMTPRWTTRQEEIDENGDRQIGVQLRLPVTLGLNQFDLEDIPGIVDTDNLGSISVTPGIDLIVPLTSRWTLRPFASIGWGTVTDGSDSAWTYWGGVKSRYQLGAGKLGWSLLANVGFVGYSPQDAASEKFWPLSVGLEFDYPLAQSGGRTPYVLYWHGMYTGFAGGLNFSGSRNTKLPVDDQWELAAAIGKRDEKIRIWFMEFDRLGLGYRFSSNGQLKGITFVFRSLFDF